MRILKIQGKCSDRFWAGIKDTDTGLNLEHKGYVLRGLNLGDDGDYISLSIDVDTGKIIGWKPFTNEEAEEYFE